MTKESEKSPEEEQNEVMPEEGSKKSPKKEIKPKIIFVEIDDEVTQVFEQIVKAKEKRTVLIIPKEAVLFQSVINLKILRKKCEEIKKELQIITKDEIGLYLGKQAGLSISNNLDESFEWKGADPKTHNLDIKPISASSNSYIIQKLKKLSENKKTIFDVLSGFRNGEKNLGRFQKLIAPFKKRPKLLLDHKMSFSMPNTRALSTLIVMSLGILIISAYVILPGATIYLTPKANVISQSSNIVLADSIKNANEIKNGDGMIIPLYFYETDLQEQMTYYASGKIFEGTNANGVITVSNASNNPWTLINNTRLQTSDGIVFRTKYYVTVPPQNSDGEPGILDVEVIADEVDIFGEIVGERGNIGPSDFFLPGLNTSNQKLLYGKSTKAMTGGLTKYREVVTEQDVFASQELIKEKVLENMEETLKKEIISLNDKYDTNFYLLLDDNLIEKQKINVITPENIEGQSLDQFDLQASMHVIVPYFNKDELINILKNELNKHTNPKKILVKTYEENLQFEIQEIDSRNDKIKITATLQGLEQFDLDANSETGQRVVKKISDNVAGKSIEEASNYIQNLPEVNKVEIVSWPKWALTIPSVTENIKIKVVNSEN